MPKALGSSHNYGLHLFLPTINYYEPKDKITNALRVGLSQGVALLGSIALLEEGFETLLLAARKPVFSCLPSEQDVELSAPPAP